MRTAFMAGKTGGTRGSVVRRALLAAFALATVQALAADELPRLPVDRDALFLGVETCGSNQCHGSREPWGNATVSMKERSIWQAHDSHAQAFASLGSDAGQHIAAKLGLADARQAPACLVCHTTHVPPAQRGPQFSSSAGVGCESCHGPGGSFLAAHVQPDSQHASNVAAGMYPTNAPGARAALCLSCHQGDDVRHISHRLYGAGHPRLRFELDTYSALQPYHFKLDADYRRRKPVASHFRLWAEGQLRAAQQLLGDLHATPATGLFPELAEFDCHACHHAIGTSTDERPRPGLHAGSLALNDAPLLVLRALAAVTAPSQMDALRDDTRALQNALSDLPLEARLAARLETRVTALANTVGTRAEQAGDARATTAALFDLARAEMPLPFATAESIAMSVATLLTADYEQQRLTADQYQQASTALDAAYAAVGNERTYRATAFVAALEKVAAALGQQ